MKSLLQEHFNIILFYGVFTVLISGITLIVSVRNIPAIDYDLNSTRPETILFAPFTNGTWSHLGSNIAVMTILLFFGLFIVRFNLPNLIRNKGFVRMLCWGPIVGGVLAAFIMFWFPGVGGAGTSVMNAALLGILMILFLELGYSNYKKNNTVELIVSLVSVVAFLYLLDVAFLHSGNAPVHYTGFAVGSMLSLGFRASILKEYP